MLPIESPCPPPRRDKRLRTLLFRSTFPRSLEKYIHVSKRNRDKECDMEKVRRLLIASYVEVNQFNSESERAVSKEVWAL